MSKLIVLSLLAVAIQVSALSANAGSSGPRVQITTTDEELTILIRGAKAEEIYDRLNVDEKVEFGIVQSTTKEIQGLSCVKARFNDIPGEMSEVRTSCTLKKELPQKLILPFPSHL